jgi:hypothetical protein
MLKTIIAAFVLCAAPRILLCEPVKYLATFTASGTLTDSGGNAQPFSGKVVFSVNNDTTKVKRIFQDGEFSGYETWAPIDILIEGLAPMKTLVPVQFYSVEGSLEVSGYVDNILLTTFVFYYTGYYNLQSAFKSQGSWSINYFNMGIIPTTKGRLQFFAGSSDGAFTGSLPEGGIQN